MNSDELKKNVELARKRDSAAMEVLYNEYYKDILYTCNRYGMNLQDAEDIAQETFIKAFTSLESLKEEEKFYSWISRIASNKCLDTLKRRKIISMDSLDNAEEVVEFPSKEKSPEDIVIDKEVYDIIEKMMQGLPIEQRVTLFMYYYQNMTAKEIAEVFRCSESTVKSRLNYARNAMRKEADNLENQGIRIRTVAALPFLYLFFNMEKEAFACEVPDGAAVIATALKESAAVLKDSLAMSGTESAVESAAELETGTKMGAVVAGKMSAGKIAAIIGAVTVATAVVAVAGVMAVMSGKDNKATKKTDMIGLEETDKETKKDTATEEETGEKKNYNERYEGYISTMAVPQTLLSFDIDEHMGEYFGEDKPAYVKRDENNETGIYAEGFIIEDDEYDKIMISDGEDPLAKAAFIFFAPDETLWYASNEEICQNLVVSDVEDHDYIYKKCEFDYDRPADDKHSAASFHVIGYKLDAVGGERNDGDIVNEWWDESDWDFILQIPSDLSQEKYDDAVRVFESVFATMKWEILRRY